MRNGFFIHGCCIIAVMWCLGFFSGCETMPGLATEQPQPSALDHAMRNVSLEEAHAKADARDRVLFVFGTADWCPPCRQMKANTWTEPNVREWIEQHAVILYLDVDEHSGLADRLEITGIPHIIAYRGGEELDRIAGYRDGETFLEWLRSVAG